MEESLFKQMMKSGIDPIETDADVECAWAATKLNAQIDNLMHTTPLEDESVNYSRDADILMNITNSEIKSLNAEEVNIIYAERTEVEVQTQIEESFVNMHQLNNNDPWNGIKTASARYLVAIVIRRISRGTPEDFMS